MDFNLTDVQLAWKAKGHGLGNELTINHAAADIVIGAARFGLVDPNIDLLAAAVAVEAMAQELAGAAVVLAVHTTGVLAVAGDDRFTSLARGESVAAIAMSSEEVPVDDAGRLTGRALWIGPLTDRGLAIVGAKRSANGAGGGELVAAIAALDAPGVRVEPLATAGLAGFGCGHVHFNGVESVTIGSPMPIMARMRVLLAAAGIGMGRRALAEALRAAHAYSRTGPGGEQTLQGLVADAATELDAASVLTWRAAWSPQLSLAEASMAKLAAAEAAQRAVARSSQVAGADAFRHGHILDRLAQDVRALEVFAGRTEGLREAVAAEHLNPTA